MTHMYLYIEDGSEKSLPALSSYLLLSNDPIEAKQLKDKHEKHNQEVIKMLNEKGFR